MVIELMMGGFWIVSEIGLLGICLGIMICMEMVFGYVVLLGIFGMIVVICVLFLLILYVLGGYLILLKFIVFVLEKLELVIIIFCFGKMGFGRIEVIRGVVFFVFVDIMNSVCV